MGKSVAAVVGTEAGDTLVVVVVETEDNEDHTPDSEL